MLITDIAIKNRTTITVLSVIIVVMGVYSYITLPREAFPDIAIPYILVDTTYEGISPEDIETSVTMKIEKELNSISGVEEITSSSAEGMSMISVEFTPDVPTEVALQRVRDRVDRAKGELPTDAEDPIISEISLAEFPIMYLSISGDLSPVQFKAIADNLQDAIEAVPGVLKVDVSGTLEPEIRLEFDPDRLALYNLTIPEILALIPSENVNISAGSLETAGTKFNIRVPAELVTAEDVDGLLLTVRDGNPIYLSDVAKVRAAFKDRSSYSRHNGTDNVTLSIRKRAGANVVLISDIISGIIIDNARKQLPESVKLDITYDMSKYIRSTVADLENNMASGLVLVIVVLVLFLGWRSSLIVSMIIPLSMLASFFILSVLGYTLNMIVLFSLILGVGMIVDSAIVIVENIYRHMELGKSRLEAAIVGTREVAWPVTASTATNIASFIPLMFWPGIMGDFMKYLPITVMIVLSSSLFVALIFNPTFCASLASLAANKKEEEHGFVRGYRRLQSLGLKNPGITLFLAFCVLISLGILYAKIGKGTEFFPAEDPERAMIDIRAPQGTNIQETDRIARQIEQRIEPYKPYIKHVVTNVGSSGGSGMSLVASAGGPHLAGITLTFYDFMERQKPSTEIITAIRNDIADISGAEIQIQQEENGPPTGAPITVRIMGEDFKTLEELGSKAQRIIAEIPNVVNLRSDLEATRPELAFTVNRRNAMLLGVNTALVGNFLKMAVFGTRLGSYRQYNDEYDITVRLPVEKRINIDELYQLQMPNAAGKAVPLSSLGTFVYQGGFGTISRVDQKRTVTLTGDTEGRLSSLVLLDVRKRLQPLGDPRLFDKDILDWNKLTQTLQNARQQPGNDVASRIWQVLPKKNVSMLTNVLTTEIPVEEQKKQILQTLNTVIQSRNLYQEADFQNNTSGDVGKLVKQDRKNLKKEEVQFLNRQLLAQVLPDIIAPVVMFNLPTGYAIDYAGEEETQEESQAFLVKAFALVLVLVTMVLVIEFNSLGVTLIIMTTVILSLIGVLLGLLVCDMPFGIIMSGIGVISLAGIVVNNGIVLLDYTRQLERSGMDVISASVEAGVIRLRPVLLSAVTNFIGLIPMAIGASFDFHTFEWSSKSESSQWWQNMAVVIIFGLSFATILTLVVVPSLYVMMTRLSYAFRFKKKTAEIPIPQPEIANL